jgi:hypothetical protein
VESKAERTYKTRGSGVTYRLRRLMRWPSTSCKTISGDCRNPRWSRLALAARANGTRKRTPTIPNIKKSCASGEQERGNRFIKYVIIKGIEDEPGRAEIDRLKEFLPGGSASDLKYLWVTETLEGEDEIGDIVGAIVGQTIPTEEGVAEAEATFPSDG